MQPDAHHLSQTYQLPLPTEMYPLAENVWLVLVEEQEYALKIYSPDTVLDHQRYEHWIILTLATMGLSFELPIPIRDQQGGTFHRSPDGSFWTLARKLSGDGMKPNDPDQAYAVGAALAEMHQALAQLPPHTRPETKPLQEPRLSPFLQAPMPAEPADLGLGDTPESHHRHRRLLNTARDLQTAPPHTDLAWHIIHGDFFGENILYNGDVVSGVLDFKFAHPDYRAREFAITLMRVTNDLGALFWGTARSFVEGYASVLGLRRAEINLVPRFITESYVEQVLRHAAQKELKRAAAALRSQEDVSAWLELEQPRLDAMLRGVFLGE